MTPPAAAIQARVFRHPRRVRARGDAAVLECAAGFDRLNAPTVAALELSRPICMPPWKAPALEKSLKAAGRRVRVYHEKQRQES